MGPISERYRQQKGRKIDRIIDKAVDGTPGRIGTVALSASLSHGESGDIIREVLANGQTVYSSR